jgi:hypothetical protein
MNVKNERAALLLAALTLAACNSNHGGSLIGGGSSHAYVRVVHGSPDGGPVDVQVDGTTIQSDIAYGAVTPYTSLAAGSHTMALFVAGNDTGTPLSTLTFSVNDGQDTTVVIEGEHRPTYQATQNFGMQAFVEQPYSTPSGGGAVDVHNAAPIAPATAGLNQGSVQFSFTAYGNTAAIGSPVSLGQATNPVGLPSNALNIPITIFATSGSTRFTTTPSQIDPSCSGIPCSTAPNLSLYFVDGPTAAVDPTSPPSTISPSARAVFFGAFDANGLLTQ